MYRLTLFSRRASSNSYLVFTQTLTVAASMRRPVFVKYTSPSPSFEPLFGADQREDATPFALGPLSLIPVCLSERREAVKGAPFLRGLRTLDRLPPFWNIEPEGKGAGVSGGLPPGGV